MDNAEEFGRKVADAAIARMKDDGVSVDEAATSAAQEIVRHADAMIVAGASADEVADWTGAAADAYGERLRDWISAAEELRRLGPKVRKH